MNDYSKIVNRWEDRGFSRVDMVLLVVALTYPEILTAVNAAYDKRGSGQANDRKRDIGR